jgi:phosphatidate cytidylyltransferase
LTRVLSALVLLPVIIGVIWFFPNSGTLLLALVASILSFLEFRTIAAAVGIPVPAVPGAILVGLTCVAVWLGDQVLFLSPASPSPHVFRGVELLMMSGVIVIGALAVARGRPSPESLASAAATLFAPLYIGLPLGALAALALDDTLGGGRLTVLLLLAVIVVSDSAQYYTGRAIGKRPLSPVISPKKTVEGAVGGVVFGALAMVGGGRYVFGSFSPVWLLALVGAAISLLGIVGDLFESLLKRSAGVKDSSNLIPGHGGVLDRIDSWLFAAPMYYVFVRFVA